MFKLPISRFLLALIKPNKPSRAPDLTLRDLETCRQLFGLPVCINDNIEEAAYSYLKERTYRKIKFDADAIYKSWQLSKPLQSEISVLSFSRQMKEGESAYLSKIVKDWSHFLLKEGMNINKSATQQAQRYRKVVVQFFEVLNSVCYLLDMDYENIQLYLRIYELARYHKVEDKNYSHLRYILDHLLQQKRIQEKDLQFILGFTSKFPMQSVYHQKEKDIISLIYNSLPKFKQQKKQNYKLFVNLLHNIGIQNEISSSMKALTTNIYHKFNNSYVRFKAFSTLIDLFHINKHNITQSIHLNNLISFINQFPKIAFKHIPKYFYRADIWIQEFWIPYFQYVSNGDNYKEIQNFHHFVIDDLLTENRLGGAKLERQALAFREFLYKKGTDIRKFDLRKQYQKSFGRIKENKSSCQLHVANSMRLICSSQILTQVPIKYFIVDVLIDQKVVVEINNNHHYKTIDGVTTLNLKSQFRQRFLERSGYRYYNIRVDDLSVSNYNMLEDIQKIVQSSNIIRPK